MRLDPDRRQIGQRLRHTGLRIRIGPFSVNLQSPLDKVAEMMAFFYRGYPLPEPDTFTDFFIRIERPAGLRRWLRPQSVFAFDGFRPFKPLPRDQAFAMFEWGLNWCIATNAHRYLIIHAAVVAKAGRALILPGEPGAGKSTLCAALVSRGWRLLSDEMALIDPGSLAITPIPRPIGLKNESIAIMQAFGDRQDIGPPVADTAKGTVAHMRPPADSIRNADRVATPAGILFPAYAAGTGTRLQRVTRPAALARTAEQSFNYHILGADGFATLRRLATTCPAYDLGYSQLDSAIAHCDDLLARGAP